MRVYGLTGGIGMGKSTCADLLVRHGVSVIDTDALARQLVEPGTPALAEIVAAFGRAILDSSQRLRRDVLAGIVFSDATARAKLEAILHPRIQTAWLAQLAEWRAAGVKTSVVVIPLLFETSTESRFDCIVCVACSERTQRARIAARGWSPEEFAQRSAAQLPIEQKMNRSRYVIWTEGSLAAHLEQVARVFGFGPLPV